MRRRRLVAVVLAWVAAAGMWRGVVALPERCPEVSVAQATGAARAAVGWFERNRLPDGRFAYRYDRRTGTVDRSVHLVRHAGVTMSLYQADAADVSSAARRLADGAARWLLRNAIRHDDWLAASFQGSVETGASALLAAGLAIRRDSTGDERFDEDLRALGRFLVAMIEPSGAVLAAWDPATGLPVPGRYSKFFTGEALFALAWLATVLPAEGWEHDAARVARYLGRHRDRAEDRFPPTSDHWASLGLAQLRLGAGVSLGDREEAYHRRLAGIFGVQVRYESQRTGDGLNRRFVRGPQALAAGVGTLGEGLGAVWRVATVDSSMGVPRAVVAERLRCVAGMLVDRQQTAADAARAADTDAGVDPDGVRGAWFTGSVTQEDDQQHALSALLAARAALDEGGGQGGGSGRPSLPRLLWLAVIAAAAMNPRRTATTLAATTAAVTAVVAVAAEPLLRAIDVSPPTALVAAGVILVPAAVADLAGRRAGATLRPGVVVLVLAVAADSGVASGLALVLAVAGAGAIGSVRALPEGVSRAAGAVALAGAVDLVVHGALGI